VREHQIDLVVIDSLGQFMAGDPNSARDVSIALRAGLGDVRTLGAAVLVIDHTTKSARSNGTTAPTPAGSQQKRAWARVSAVIETAELGGQPVNRWSLDKTNAKGFKPFLTKLDFVEDEDGNLETVTLVHVGADTGRASGRVGNDPVAALEAREDVLRRLGGGPLRRGDLPKGGSYTRAISDLLESGLIQKGEGHTGAYSLSPPAESPLPFPPDRDRAANRMVPPNHP